MRFATALVAVAMAFAPSAHAHDASPYAWLLAYQWSNPGAVDDKRFGALVDATAPRYFSDVGSRGGRKLRNQLRAAMGGPPGAIHVDDQRHVSFGSCEPHDCGVKAFLWVDLATGASIGALGSQIDHDAHGRWPMTLLVFSRTTGCRSIPPAFERALDAWIAVDVREPVDSRRFIDRRGHVAKECR